MANSREFDFVIWGATGFTGKQACEYVARAYGLPSAELRYAIAARTSARLDAVEKMMVDTAKLHNKTNGASAVPKIIASVDDEASVVSMCRRAKAVVALAGPYSQCGEAVLKACAQNGTHYSDATGEVSWVLKMREMYNNTAITNKAKIAPACGGLEFMPSEVAMIFLNQMCVQRNLTLETVHMQIEYAGSGVSGGTLRSLFNMFKGMTYAAIQNFVSDPYVLCKERPTQDVINANKMPTIGIAYNNEAKLWYSPSFLSPQFATHIRWSNEIQNFVWGRNLAVRVSELSTSIFWAVLRLLFLWVFPPMTYLLSRLPLDRFIPDSGHATFETEKVNKSKFIRMHLSADAIDKTSKAAKKVEGRVNCPHEVYYLSGISTVEAALTAVFGETPPVYGVSTPSAVLGQAYLSRMEKQDITVATTSVK